MHEDMFTAYRTGLAVARAIRANSESDVDAILGPMTDDELRAALFAVCGLIATDHGSDDKAFNLKLDAFLKVVNDAEIGVF